MRSALHSVMVCRRQCCSWPFVLVRGGLMTIILHHSPWPLYIDVFCDVHNVAPKSYCTINFGHYTLRCFVMIIMLRHFALAIALEDAGHFVDLLSPAARGRRSFTSPLVTWRCLLHSFAATSLCASSHHVNPAWLARSCKYNPTRPQPPPRAGPW